MNLAKLMMTGVTTSQTHCYTILC